MNVNTSLERLLPSLHNFLAADPAVAASLAASPTSPSPRAPTSPFAASACELVSPPQEAVAESYERWRRCITVWRRVIGNDILFLTLLLHAGCLWSPDYAAVHRAKLALAQARLSTTQERKDTGSGERNDIHNNKKRNTKSVGEGATDDMVVPSAEVREESAAPSKRRNKRVFFSAAEATRAALAEAAAAAAHQRLVEACPASLWALHVLHFLRVEEIYDVPVLRSHMDADPHTSSNKRSGEEASGAKVHDDSDDDNQSGGGSSGDSDGSSSSNSSGSSSETASEGSGSESDSTRHGGVDKGGDAEDGIVDVAGGAAAAKRADQRGAKRGADAESKNKSFCGERRRRVSSQRSLTAGRRRKRVRFEEGMKAAFGAHHVTASTSPSSPSARAFAASSCLLPKCNAKHRGGKKELQHSLELALQALRQDQAERGGVGAQDNTTPRHATPAAPPPSPIPALSFPRVAESSGFPAGSTETVSAEKASPQMSTRAHALLLRATVTLVSEEEPLVQHVAAALVDDWLELMTPAPPVATTLSISSADTIKHERCSGVMDPRKGGSTVNRTASSSPHPNDTFTTASAASSSSTSLLLAQQQCEARHYWLSCLLKMTAYLDGIHSALREENTHLAAVMARQGIDPQDAEDTFTKSLPAILNCVLVEEVLQTSSVDPSRSVASAHTSPRLWMPPPVLLLPFHLLGRGSRVGVWVPLSLPAAAAGSGSERGDPPFTAPSSSRTQGRFLTYTVDSYGPHLASRPARRALRKQSRTGMKDEDKGRSSGTAGATVRADSKRYSDEAEGSSGGEMDSEGSVARLVFGVRAAERETLLGERERAWIDEVLPPLHASASLPFTQSAPPVALPQSAEGTLQDAPTPARVWCCTQAATAGCPRVELYVARTLVMLPIPAQSSSDSTSNVAPHSAGNNPLSSSSISGGGGVSTRNSISGGGSSSSGGDPNARSVNRFSSEDTRRVGSVRWRNRRAATLSPEEAAVRRRHPLLYQTLQPYLRPSNTTPTRGTARPPTFNSIGSRTTPGEEGSKGLFNNNFNNSSDPPQLILLCGVARGPATTVLRHLGFSVRTGSHYGFGRGGGAAGGRPCFEVDSSQGSARDAMTSLPSSAYEDTKIGSGSGSSGSSSGGGGGGSKGSTGRLTLARDALGTTLEGLCLMARRIMALRGLYATSGLSAPADQPRRTKKEEEKDGDEHEGAREEGSDGKGKGALRSAGDEGSERRGPHSHAYRGGKGGYDAGTSEAQVSSTTLAAPSHPVESCGSIISPAQEAEVLSATAATLALTALLLSHNLMDELLEQSSMVLWTTELASYIVDIALYVSRPIPRLFYASGFALALLLQPAQSLLLMVGLTSTLVTREVEQQQPQQQQQQTNADSVHHSTHPAGSAWQPWWTVFRGTVLRDATLPSCLHPGVWALVVRADEAVARAVAEARWETSGHGDVARRGCGNKSSASRRNGGGAGRRVLHLTATTTRAEKKRPASVNFAHPLTNLSKERFPKDVAKNDAGTGAISTRATTSTTIGDESLHAVGGHRIQLTSPQSSLTAAGATANAIPLSNAPAEANAGTASQWVFGAAVLHPTSRIGKDRATAAQGGGEKDGVLGHAQVQALRVISGAEMSFVLDSPSDSRLLTPQSAHTAAAASGLWLSLEATCLQWPSSPNQR